MAFNRFQLHIEVTCNGNDVDLNPQLLGVAYTVGYFVHLYLQQYFRRSMVRVENREFTDLVAEHTGTKFRVQTSDDYGKTWDDTTLSVMFY